MKTTYEVTVYMPVGGEKTQYAVDTMHEGEGLARAFSECWCNPLAPAVTLYEVRRSTEAGVDRESRELKGSFVSGMEV